MQGGKVVRNFQEELWSTKKGEVRYFSGNWVLRMRQFKRELLGPTSM